MPTLTCPWRGDNGGMRDIRTQFADYAAYHQTAGNKLFHRIGIPFIVVSLLGMLARVPIVRAGSLKIDAAILLIALAQLFYLRLDWRLGLAMLMVSVLLYFAGAALPFAIDVVLFLLGWIFQFIGHSLYEHRQPAFLTNAVHLLVGPLWILNDLVPVVKS